jgi:hypothetical protein
MFPTELIFLTFQRVFIRGITARSLKGQGPFPPMTCLLADKIFLKQITEDIESASAIFNPVFSQEGRKIGRRDNLLSWHP